LSQDEECKIEIVEKTTTKGKKVRGGGGGGGGGKASKESRGGDKGVSLSGQQQQQAEVITRKVLTVQDGTEAPLDGIGIYFIRTSTKRTLGYCTGIER
jgi:hypothetical protein